MTTDNDNYKLVSLIYEAAEDIECWPKLLEAYRNELIEAHQNSYLGQQTTLLDKAISLSESSIPSATLSDNDEELLKHLQRALRINRKIDTLTSKVGTTENILNYLPLGILTVDSQGMVTNTNALAQNLLISNNAIRIEKNRLVTNSPKSTMALMKIITNAIDESDTAQTTYALKISDGNNDNVISLFAIKSTTDDSNIQAKLCTLFIATNIWSSHISTKVLHDLYQLTPAEARLTKNLARGLSLNDAAEQMSISQHTARNQLKSIFSKTETHRQSELLGLIFSTPLIYNSKPTMEGSNNNQHLEINCQTPNIILEDGRQLQYAEYGNLEGIPVFYCHCVVIWPWWELSEKQQLSDLDIRLIVPYRAGYGQSSFHQQASLNSYADDIKQLADALELPEFYILGFSSGGPYAAACAYHLKDRCAGLSLVSSIAPLDNLAELEMMKPAMSRLVLGFARFAKRLYTSFFKMLLKSIIPNSKAYITNYISQWSPYDKNLIEQPHILQSIDESFLRVVNNGAAGLIHESTVIANPWGFLLSDLHVNTTIWRGENDLAVPPTLTNKFSSITNASIKIMPNCGHLHIADFWQDILKDLTYPKGKA